MLRLALAVLVASASVAHASPPGMTPVYTTPAPEAEADGPKNPGLAVLLSLGTTLAGFIVIASAEDEGPALLGMGMMIVGPSTGRWYSGNASFSGIGLRTLATASMFYGVMGLMTYECDFEYEGDCSGGDDLPAAMLLGGGALFVGSAVVDMIFAHRDARDYNARHLSLAPMRMQTPSGGATGLALTGRF